MTQPVEAVNPAPDARSEAPSLKMAFLGFFTSTMLTCSVMVLLSSL